MISGRYSLSLLCAATTLALIVPASARAASAEAIIDADAAVVLRVDPASLFELVRILGDMPGLAGGGIALARSASASQLGSDVLDRQGYRAAGFDSKRAMWIQLGAIDEDDMSAAYERLAAEKNWTPVFLRKTRRALWRSRVLIPIANRKQARQTLMQLLTPVTKMITTQAKNEDELAMLLGARTDRGKEILAALKGPLAVSAIGWVPGLDGYLVLRITRSLAVIELISPFAGVPLEWQRDRRKLLGALAPLGRRRGGFAEDIGRGAKANLRKPGVHVWTSSANLLVALRALTATEELRRIGESTPRRLNGPSCAALRELGQKGAIRDVALSIETSRQRRVAKLSWGARGKLAWLRHLGRELRVPHRKDAIAAFHTHLGGLDAITKLHRPRPLRGPFSAGLRSLLLCPSGSLTAMVLTAWPELFASFVADLGHTHATAATIAKELGPTSLSVRKADGGEQQAVAIVESHVGSAAESIGELLATVFGDVRDHSGIPVWGRGPILAYQRGSDRIGFALGERSLSWWLADDLELEAKPRPGVLAHGQARLAILLREASAEHPMLTPFATLAERHLETVEARLEIAADRVDAIFLFGRAQ